MARYHRQRLPFKPSAIAATVLAAILLTGPTASAHTTFGAEQVITSGADAARRVFAADLDGDGDQDVLSASSNDDKIAWYENTDGLGTFGPEQIITTSADSAFGVFAADLDGDGDQDVLSASVEDDKIAWYENTDGEGTFGPQQVISTAADGPPWVYAADLDGDGDQDVLSASVLDDKIAWYENTDGIGNFGPQQVITTATHVAYAVIAADLDWDGDLDLLSASESDDKIAWYENIDGLGNFGPQQIITTAANGARAVFAADLDGDGDLDVLSASLLDDKIAWYENTDGVGSFGGQRVITTIADEGESVSAADLDGDGDLDVLSASSFDSKIAWYENTDGLGNFGPQRIITTSAIQAFWVVAADLDGDGDQDVLSASFIDDEIAWYENTEVSIGGAVTGMGPFRGLCTNVTTGEKVNIALSVASTWNCEDAGLVVDPGDAVFMIEAGVAGAFPETLGGSVTGLSPSVGACRNNTTGDEVIFLILAGESSWNCKTEGLVVNVGDIVFMIEVGIVE